VYKIAVIPGDGTGPEVTVEAVKMLKVAADKFKFKVDLTEFDFGGERYKRTGETLPDSAVEELRKFDTILLGAVGHPEVAPGILEKGILLKLRFALDQYINLRPVKLYPGVETPLKDKGAGRYRLRGCPRKYRRPIYRRGRLHNEGDATGSSCAIGSL